MAYVKVGWQADMLLTPARFRQMETQHDEVLNYWGINPFRMLSSSPLITEVSSTEPANEAGRIYFNESTDEYNYYVSNGTSWADITELMQEAP